MLTIFRDLCVEPEIRKVEQHARESRVGNSQEAAGQDQQRQARCPDVVCLHVRSEASQFEPRVEFSADVVVLVSSVGRADAPARQCHATVEPGTGRSFSQLVTCRPAVCQRPTRC